MAFLVALMFEKITLFPDKLEKIFRINLRTNEKIWEFFVI